MVGVISNTIIRAQSMSKIYGKYILVLIPLDKVHQESFIAMVTAIITSVIVFFSKKIIREYALIQFFKVVDLDE